MLQYGRLHVAINYAPQATINLNDLSLRWPASKNLFYQLNHIKAA